MLGGKGGLTIFKNYWKDLGSREDWGTSFAKEEGSDGVTRKDLFAFFRGKGTAGNIGIVSPHRRILGGGGGIDSFSKRG